MVGTKISETMLAFEINLSMFLILYKMSTQAPITTQITPIVFLYIMVIGLVGILTNWRHAVSLIFGLEVINISSIMYIATISEVIFDMEGRVFSCILLWLTASESALVLGILIVLFKFGGTIRLNKYANLKG